jgi:hypothetical protein
MLTKQKGLQLNIVLSQFLDCSVFFETTGCFVGGYGGGAADGDTALKIAESISRLLLAGEEEGKEGWKAELGQRVADHKPSAGPRMRLRRLLLQLARLLRVSMHGLSLAPE